MNRTIVRIAAMVGLSLLLHIVSPDSLHAQGDPNIFVNVTSKQDKSTDAKYGKEYHESLREMLENRIFNGIKSAYPCIHYLDQSAVKQMIGVEKMRELLGADGESRLPAIANAVGAGHLGFATVTVIGGTVVISGGMMDSSSSKTIGRAQTTAPAGNENAIYAAMTQFVSNLVASAGSDGPKCARWQGEISASSSMHERGKNPNGDPFSIDTDLKITCQIGGKNENEPSCQVSYSYKMGGKDSSITTSAGGPARCNAGAGIYKGIGKIRVGSCQVEATSNVSVAGISASSKENLSLGGWEVEFPVMKDARQLTGSKEVDKNATVNWSLTYR